MKQLFVVLLTLIVIGSVARAQWSTNPVENNAISTASGTQYGQVIESDGAGGAIIAWIDYRAGSAIDVYVQRIDNAGFVLWTADGVNISSVPTGSYSYSSAILADGTGGAIIVWSLFVGGTADIYAQRVNSSGAVQWTTGGVPIVVATGSQYEPAIASDGAGGAIITWYDYRSGSVSDIYAQRIDSTGVVQWAVDGIAVSSTAPGTYEYSPAILNDGTGGAIITWYNYSGATGNYDIYAQRVNASGIVQWTAGGVPISTAPNYQYQPKIESDGSGGAIIAWTDYRALTTSDIYAQRIDSMGVVQWTTDGVAIATAGYPAYQTKFFVSDGAGGAIFTWIRYPGGSNTDVFAQRVDGAGVLQWSPLGIAISTGPHYQFAPVIASDGDGGALIAWYDSGNGSSWDIFAQRVSNAGVIQWRTDGIPISVNGASQYNPVIVADGSGGAVIAWNDYRNDYSGDIYAQNIHPEGDNLSMIGEIVSALDIPRDQGGKVRLSWTRATTDTNAASLRIGSYGIWRKVSPLASISKRTALRPPFALMNDSLNNYDYVMSVPAIRLPKYNVVVPTLEDSSGAGTPWTTFLVTAHATNNPSYYFAYPADSGFSVDNLAPAAVQSLIAQTVAGPSVNLQWSPNTVDPDVHSYEIYRSTTAGFTPSPATVIGTSTGSSFTDNSPVIGSENHYRLVTIDVHGNHGVPSAQATAGVTTTQAYNVRSRWNLVSLPMTLGDYTKTEVFPTATSHAFAYESAYVVKSALSNRAGYWVKFDGAQSVSMAGFPRVADTIDVVEGWNLIGSISSSVPVAAIASIPEGIVTSEFFGYTGSYSTVSSIEPGGGYWVKVNQAGKFVLAADGVAAATNRITIVHSEEVPPSPPAEAFSLDAMVPDQFSLGQNYPNPFNPSTIVAYGLPQNARTILKLYNTIGQEIRTLVDEVQEAGYHSITVRADDLPSGIYFYRLDAVSIDVPARQFTEVRKMILLK